MVSGAAVRKNFPGMKRSCAKCGGQITVTEQMCKRRKYQCGPCQSKASAEYVRRNRQKKREWNNAYHRRISGERSEATARWRANHPEKRTAHQAVQTALRNGTIHRSVCEVCGNEIAHAHHDDYSKPLEVRWLCHYHHMEHHSMISAREAKS